MSQVLVPEEVAEVAQVKPATVMRWLRSGKLRGSKNRGGLWSIRIDDLNAFLTDSGRPLLPVASIERSLTVALPVEELQLTTEPLTSGSLEKVVIRQGPRPWSIT
jgi:excisionase family DNA binding protein